MAQPVADLPAEVEANAGGPLVRAAVAAGIAVLKHPGQVLRRNTDAIVLNDQSISLGKNPHCAAPGVLHRVGEHLLHHKAQPLLIGEDPEREGLQVQGHPAVDKELGVFAHRLPHDLLQRYLPDEIVRGVAAQAEILQHHLHILLDLEQLRRQLPAPLRVVPLEQQVHGGDGGLDLVGPEGIVLHHLPPPFIPLGHQGLPVPVEDLQQLLIGRLDGAPGLRKILQPQGHMACQCFQGPPPAPPQ